MELLKFNKRIGLIKLNQGIGLIRSSRVIKSWHLVRCTITTDVMTLSFNSIMSRVSL